MTASAWMRHWFGGGADSAKTDRQRIRYSAQLVPGLRYDHAELLALFGEIERMALSRRCATITAALAGFKSRFDMHVMNENLHLYGYLEERLGTRNGSAARVRQFRTEMTGIGRSVVKFIRKYDKAGVQLATVDAFLEELRAMGAELKTRLEREEKELYPLYQP